jgi:lipoprotein-anchoring transpeptidase ErfK/SrfK
LRVLLAAILLSAAAVAQPQDQKAWVPPGTPGSPISGELFHAQVLLDAAGFSPGVIDGRNGSSFKQALKGFQEARGLDVTGKLDTPTRQALLSAGKPSTVNVRLGNDDVVARFVRPIPTKYEDQAKLPFLGYRNMLEKLAERYHTTPETVVALNGPDKLIGAGQVLRLPNVVPSSRDYSGAMDKQGMLMNLLNVAGDQHKGDHIVVDKSDSALRVMDEGDRLIAQFPVTTGSTHDPLPIGNWKVTTYAFLPPFNFQPDLFWDVSDNKAEQRLPPGPNGPVGVAWLDLTKEHYGIHGTAEPQTIGKTQSHGCIRMTNWDVIRLSRMLKPGFKAVFQA